VEVFIVLQHKKESSGGDSSLLRCDSALFFLDFLTLKDKGTKIFETSITTHPVTHPRRLEYTSPMCVSK